MASAVSMSQLGKLRQIHIPSTTVGKGIEVNLTRCVQSPCPRVAPAALDLSILCPGLSSGMENFLESAGLWKWNREPP
jgi:hypothetical protein